MRYRVRRTLSGLLNRVFLLLELRLLPGLAQRLVLIGGLILSLSLLGGAAVSVFSAEGGSLGENAWWAFLHLTDPGYLGDDQGLARRIVATLLTIAGLVVFVGLLVAVMTQWMTQRITAFERGITRVPFRDHIVILGWTTRTIGLVRELLSSGPRVQELLRTRGDSGLRVVVLDDEVDHEMHLALKDGLGDLYDPRRVLLRYGSPLRSEHLDRANIAGATAVILPAVAVQDATQVSSDAQVIKTLMAAAAALDGLTTPPPPMIVELSDPSKTDLAFNAYPGPVESIAAERFLAQLITQNLRYTGLSHVYRDLLSHATGNELYAPRVPALDGVPFDEARRRFSGGILLGWVTSGEKCRATLCPAADAVIEPGTRVLVLGRSLEACTPAATARRPVTFPPADVVAHKAPAQRRILILGWSRKVPALLQELDGFAQTAQQVDIVSVQPIAEREHALARANIQLQRLEVNMIEAEFTNRFELAALQPWACDDIAVLASDWIADVDEADARAVLAYLMLRQVLEDRPEQPDIVVELLDEHSEPMLGSERHEVVVAPELISHMLTHVALRRELAPVFGDIFTPGGAEVAMVSAARYKIGPGAYRFNAIADAVAARGDVALGVRFAGADVGAPHAEHGGVYLNPARNETLELRAQDELVVLKMSNAPERPEAVVSR